jgi:carboxyl-terminal processing protease
MLRTFACLAVLTLTACAAAPSPTGPYDDVLTAVDRAMEDHHYDPSALKDPRYRATQRKVAALAATAPDRDAFVAGFNAIWRAGPFSHVDLAVARASAAETAAAADAMRVGGSGATLSWDGDIAVLTVTTMMGADTIEQIDAAYDAIAATGAKALIVDLRANGGGAFAGIPLVGHVLTAPVETGAFVSRDWAAHHDRPPVLADAMKAEPWTGWSVTAFWRDVQTRSVTRIQFAPMAPRYDGPVYVLVSGRTASAAEMAADAFKASGRATLIGETTAGRMLSQTMYDLPQGLQVSLPIADYYAWTSGRIEGAGVVPDVKADAADAMGVALERARGG